MSLLSCLAALMILLWGSSIGAKITWSIGDQQRAWISAGAVSEALDSTTLEGWIRPDSLSTQDNLALGSLQRGGEVSSPQGSMRLQESRQYEGSKGKNLMKNIIDGDPATVFEMDEESARGTLTGFVVLDLGGIIPGVRQISFWPRPEFADRFMRGYDVAVNDGSVESVDAGGSLVWQQVRRNEDNEESLVVLDLPPQPVRYIKLQSRTTLPWEVAELEVRGGGFVRRASYTSEIIEVGGGVDGLANLGRLTWDARIDPGARLEIRSRSGKTPDPFKYFQLQTDQAGNVLEVLLPVPDRPGTAKEQFEALAADERLEVFDNDNWSFWSVPYQTSGELVASPSPRGFFQFKIDLISQLHTERVEMNSLSFDFSSPIMAHDLSAQIEPPLVPAGETVSLRYLLEMEVQSGDTGFNALEVFAPGKVGNIRDFAINDVAAAFDSLSTNDSGFRLFFPRITAADKTLSFVFDTQVLVYGTQFGSKVFDSEAPEEVPQTPEPETSRLVVNVALDNTMLRGLAAAPNPFTPNGDGTNDQILISYQVLKVLEPVQVVLTLYDLAGNPLRRAHFNQTFGTYEWLWDGTDAAGQLVPAGLYLYGISVETQRRTDSKLGTLGVVY